MIYKPRIQWIKKFSPDFLTQRVINWIDCLLIFAIHHWLIFVHLDKEDQIWFAGKLYGKKGDVSSVTEVDPSKEILCNSTIWTHKILNSQNKARSCSKRAHKGLVWRSLMNEPEMQLYSRY